ncbi:LuxR C-terminal-related transcriptional regulator [Robbsia sp. KACC 23696]|uniref:LuxR C-terminal-related transcriptional regulator n=1 Tax=Robbsia sp. KACC 23696 TaxID=3149231 RepID=UPI00325B9E0A
MSGRDDVEACAIRVMLADDHRATLCGIAVMLDAPFTVDWLRRMERTGLPPGRHGDSDAEDAVTPTSRGMRRRSSAAERGDARTADTMTARIEIDRVVAGLTDTTASPTASPATVAPSSLGVRSIAVWHPTPDSAVSPHRAGAARRGTAMRATDDDGDDEWAHGRRDSRVGADDVDDGPTCGALGRLRVRDGIPVIDKEDTRNGACDASIDGARRGGTTSPDERALGNVVVTGAFSRSAELFEALATTPCDVLVCDLAMGDGPHGDGLTMIGYLRRHYPCVKLIVHTMCLHACVLRNLQLLRVPGIVSKMDDIALIRRAVGVVHKGGVYHGPSIAAALEQAGYQDTDTDRPAIWSKREAEVIRRFVNGDPVKDIAQALNRSVKTVSTQKMSAMHKAGINSNAELYQYAAANGLLLMPGAAGSNAWQWCEHAEMAHALNVSPSGAGIATDAEASLPVAAAESSTIG